MEEEKMKLYIETRKKLLIRFRNLLVQRENLSKKINSLRKELNNLDNMIL